MISVSDADASVSERTLRGDHSAKNTDVGTTFEIDRRISADRWLENASLFNRELHEIQ
jgi:hypothetical protein